MPRRRNRARHACSERIIPSREIRGVGRHEVGKGGAPPCDVPAVYFTRQFVDRGGLIAYGPDIVDQFRQAAGYVDRILGAAGLAMITCPAYFWSEENESPQMPLTRLNDSAFDAQLEGVYFGMWNGSRPVRCFVSHDALTDKAQGSGQAESLDVFHEYRSEIENLASTKDDARQIKSDGLVVIDSADLNPEQFQQWLA